MTDILRCHTIFIRDSRLSQSDFHTSTRAEKKRTTEYISRSWKLEMTKNMIAVLGALAGFAAAAAVHAERYG